MTAAPAAIAIVVALTCAACDDGEQVRPPTPRDDADAASSTGVQLSGRTFYLGDEAGHCFVYWREGGKPSPPSSPDAPRLDAMCPREIAAGERIRLAGRTCIRESDTPDRNVPVRCPYALVKAEEKHRDRDAGP